MKSDKPQFSASRQSSGFTLIELLSSIAIIAILVGVLLPAVQAAREAARANTCRSHLKQISLATHNFELTHGHLPGGGWGYKWQGFADLDGPNGNSGGWAYSLLPFLEQQAAYDDTRFHVAAASRDAALRKLLNTPVGTYNCPSRRGGEAFPVSDEDCRNPIGSLGPINLMVRGDYAINAGDGEPNRKEWFTWPLPFAGPVDLQQANDWTEQGLWPQPPEDWSGVSYLRQTVRLRSIRDGLSHTILIGEKYVDPVHYGDGQDWGDNENLYSGFNNDHHRSTNPFWKYMRDSNRTMSIGSFGSAHAAGHFSMLDGSVRAVAYEIDEQIFRHLGNRHDGTGTTFE